MPEDVGALRSLRKFTRDSVIVTVPVLSLLPVMSLVGGEAALGYRIAILTGAVVVNVWFVSRIVRAITHGPWEPLPLKPTVTLIALSIAITVLAVIGDPDNSGTWALVIGATSSQFALGYSGWVRWRPMLLSAASAGLVCGAVALLAGQGWSPALVLVAVISGVTLMVAIAMATMYKQWDLTLRLEQARKDAAELAATKERLRFTEDLHDILGHALEVVSLKSELATKLRAADPDRSYAEMAEVQRLARDALRDVRALVHGRRATDLATELVGARSLLTSAGIACDFTADPGRLTDPERELLGRVLREAVTNLLRHADARTCGVTLTVDQYATLRVLNDGAGPSTEVGEGSGLKGLTRRISEAGGSFAAINLDGTFEVVASLPRGVMA